MVQIKKISIINNDSRCTEPLKTYQVGMLYGDHIVTAIRHELHAKMILLFTEVITGTSLKPKQEDLGVIYVGDNHSRIEIEYKPV